MKHVLMILMVMVLLPLCAQNTQYEPSLKYPYGSLHPEAPKQLTDFAEMIGLHDCSTIQRNPDGSWQDTLRMTWKFKYILNGRAVQDETWHESGFSATSIRTYNPDSATWIVTYNSSVGAPLTSTPWYGNRKENQIILEKEQAAPTGQAGFNRLTFFDITEKSFSWKGVWTDNSTIVYPFWQIHCQKIKE